jgi:hypothetical protein
MPSPKQEEYFSENRRVLLDLLNRALDGQEIFKKLLAWIDTRLFTKLKSSIYLYIQCLQESIRQMTHVCMKLS